MYVISTFYPDKYYQIEYENDKVFLAHRGIYLKGCADERSYVMIEKDHWPYVVVKTEKEAMDVVYNIKKFFPKSDYAGAEKYLTSLKK